MRIAALLFVLASATLAQQITPFEHEINLTTIHGPVELRNLKIHHGDGSLILEASIVNKTLYDIDSPTLSVLVSGYDFAPILEFPFLAKVPSGSEITAKSQPVLWNSRGNIRLDQTVIKDVKTWSLSLQEQQRLLSEEKKKTAARAAARSRIEAAPKLNNGQATQILIGSDKKCLQEGITALEMEGIEKRKRLAELISFRCIGFVSSMAPVEILESTSGMSRVEVLSGPDVGASGWVLASWIKPGVAK